MDVHSVLYLHSLLALTGHPAASASCTILGTSTATIVTSPNAATMAKIVSIVSVFIFHTTLKCNIYNFLGIIVKILPCT